MHKVLLSECVQSARGRKYCLPWDTIENISCSYICGMLSKI